MPLKHSNYPMVTKNHTTKREEGLNQKISRPLYCISAKQRALLGSNLSIQLHARKLPCMSCGTKPTLSSVIGYREKGKSWAKVEASETNSHVKTVATSPICCYLSRFLHAKYLQVRSSTATFITCLGLPKQFRQTARIDFCLQHTCTCTGPGPGSEIHPCAWQQCRWTYFCLQHVYTPEHMHTGGEAGLHLAGGWWHVLGSYRFAFVTSMHTSKF